MQEECEGTIWLPVDSELRPLPLMLSKNTPWLMRGEIMREGHKTVAEVKSSAAQKKFQLTSDHNKLFFFLFLLSGSIPKFHFNSYFFLIPGPLGVPEGCNCRLWIYLLNQIMRSHWSDSCQKLLDVLKADNTCFLISLFSYILSVLILFPFPSKPSTAYVPIILLDIVGQQQNTAKLRASGRPSYLLKQLLVAVTGPENLQHQDPAAVQSLAEGSEDVDGWKGNNL